MDGTALTASDVALLNKSGMDWGDNSFLWIFALLLLGSGNFGFGGSGRAITEADLCNANSFTELKSATMNISDQIGNMNIGLTKGLCDMGYTTLSQFNQLERQIADCCCSTQRAVDSVKFDLANYSAATNQAISDGVQSVKDMIRDYQEQNMRDENMRNYIQSQFCGVVRYPTSTTYATNCNPFGGYNCGVCQY